MRDLAERLAARRARGHLPDDAALARRRAGGAPRASASSRSTDAGPRLPRRAAHARAAAALRSRRARHLWRHGRAYDVVHTASFPYFPVSRPRRRDGAGGTRSSSTGSRSGRARTGGATRAGRAARRLARAARCASPSRTGQLHLAPLGRPARRGGLPRHADRPPRPLRRPGRAAAGRRSTRPRRLRGPARAEKRIDALVEAFARARRRRPALRLAILGDGPDRPRIEALVAASASATRWRSPASFPEDEVGAKMAARGLPRHRVRARGLRARRRRGRGAAGRRASSWPAPRTPPTDLVEEGVNGAVAPSAAPDALADALSARRGGSGPATVDRPMVRGQCRDAAHRRSLELIERTYAAAARPT